MRRFLALAGALALSATALRAQQLTVVRSAAVHLFPSAESRRIGAVRAGQKVFLLSELRGYDRVELPDSSVGWIYAEYLRPRTSDALVVRQAGAPAVRDSAHAVAASGTATTTTTSTAATTTPTRATSAPADTARAERAAGGPAAEPSADVAALPHPAPREEHDPACADVGRGNGARTTIDTATDLLKNRVDEGRYHDVAFSEVLRLPWRGLPVRRYEWTDEQRRQVAKDEGAAISLVGYIIGATREGREQTNCELGAADWHDWHIWLVATEAEASHRDKRRAVVVEVTPRVRRLDTGRFDLQQIRRWAREGQRVRVSGWLLLDPDHPDQVGTSRGTIWEIHPVMKIEPVP